MTKRPMIWPLKLLIGSSSFVAVLWVLSLPFTFFYSLLLSPIIIAGFVLYRGYWHRLRNQNLLTLSFRFWILSAFFNGSFVLMGILGLLFGDVSPDLTETLLIVLSYVPSFLGLSVSLYYSWNKKPNQVVQPTTPAAGGIGS
jgi:hypothetical protein